MVSDKNNKIEKIFLDDIRRLDSNGSHVKKDEIIEFAKENNVKIKAREGKESIINKIIKEGLYNKLFERFKDDVYIPNWVVGRFYGFNYGEEIDQLKTIGVIKEDTIEESYYSRDIKGHVTYNAYPMSVLNYNDEQLKDAYNLAFNQLDFKLRLETKGTEEIELIEEALKKIFILKNNPIPYEGRVKGYRTYYNISLLNNSEQETNRLLVNIQSLKNQIDRLNKYHKEEVKRINEKWCNLYGVKSFQQAEYNKYLLENYKNRIESLKEKINELEKKNKNPRGAGRKSLFSDDKKVLILKDRENGLTINELANKYNCSCGTIHKLIHEK